MIEINIMALLNEWVSALISGFIPIWAVTKASLGIIGSMQRMYAAFQLDSLTRRFEVVSMWAIKNNYQAHSKHPWAAETYIGTFYKKRG